MGVKAASESGPRIGVFGGTFDPIHHGHLAIARAAAAALHLDQVIFVPSGNPYLRSVPKASAELRLKMVAAAVAGEPQFSVSRVDVDRPGPSYSLDTLADLRRVLPPKSELFLIIGADILMQLDRWHDPQRLLQEAKLVCVGRPGFTRPERLPPGHPGRAALFVEGPMFEVSATEVRARLARGTGAEALVPAAVLDIIRANHLYEDTQDRERGEHMTVKPEMRSRVERILNLATDLGALQFGEFTLSSGQKSRYYFDDRLLTLHPEGLHAVAESFLPLIEETDAVAVGGPTVAADPIVGALTLLSGMRGHPLLGFLVRSQAKAHGMGKQVEGPLVPGSKVVVVDGTLSTGGSVFTAIQAVEAQGCQVVRVLTILDRHQGGSDQLRQRGYAFATLLEATPEGEIQPAL